MHSALATRGAPVTTSTTARTNGVPNAGPTWTAQMQGMQRVFTTGGGMIDIEREIKSIARKFALHFGWDLFRQRHQVESIRRMLRMLELTQEFSHANEKASGKESRSIQRARRAARPKVARVDTKVLPAAEIQFAGKRATTA